MLQIFVLCAITVTVALDQLIKWVVVLYLKPIGQTQALFGLVRLRYTENTGAAFSMFENATTLLAALTAIVLCVCLFLLLTRKIENLWLYWAVASVTAGGLGNLLDRVIHGYVVDYIEPVFMNFAIFNFADCFVTVGACLMLGWVISETVQDRKTAKKAA